MGHVRSMLRCVSVCCSVLQCIVMCCSVLQCVAVCCSVLQCGAVCCSELNYASTQSPMSHIEWIIFAVRCTALQCVAVCCTYARVAVGFPSGPVCFLPAAQLCGKMSKKKPSQPKRPTKKLSQSHRLKVFSTLHRTEDSEASAFWTWIQTKNANSTGFEVSCFVQSNTKQQWQNTQKEAYCLFWSHFFRLV